MPRTDKPDFDAKLPPFDQLKGVHPLTAERRGHVSQYARHHLYVGTDRRTNTSALIKVTSRPGLTYEEALNNEIASLLSINRRLPDSQYFPLVSTHGKLPDGRVYLVVSFFAELPLATAIGPDRISAKAPTYVRTAMEIARALGALHALGIYHVDLNPMNVLLRVEHDRPIIRIIDFESSYESDRHGAGAFYNPPITPGYSAPEVPSLAPDARSDVFSWGAVLYTMLAGYAWAWETDVAKCVELDAYLDPDLKQILRTAVAADPDTRYPSMKDCYTNLAAYAESVWPGRFRVESWPEPL